MKKSIARLVSKLLVNDAGKSSRSEKTLVGAMPVPQELKKK
ncbi:hypothetical protein ACFQ5D_22550 [Paenibacillus farraposensis]|uniref:Cyclic lactone autoinducer peptide n=1 Tax=Paenibacillus farraposensis TaxID=2807095 RepID=A0ABW4DMA1_9BACL|nr:hypothetical protein [Paenibacillus farraposensis]